MKKLLKTLGIIMQQLAAIIDLLNNKGWSEGALEELADRAITLAIELDPNENE